MVFITGATGLVGARLVYDLSKINEQLFVLKRSTTNISKLSGLLQFYTQNPNDIIDKITWIDGDICDADCLLENIPAGCDVYHCAAMVSFNPKDKYLINETNVQGTANIVNASIINGVRKFCHVSSIGALGEAVDGKDINEDTAWSASEKAAYSLSKYYSEMEVWRGIVEGLNAVIVNPAVILGAGDWSSGSPEFFSSVNKGMKYFTHGTTSYVYVNDVSKAMLMLMKSDICNERFILASETLSYKEIFTQVANAIGAKLPKKEATKLHTSIAYRAEKFICVFNNKTPRITKQTHRVAHLKDSYNGSKICKKISFNYTPIGDAILEIGRIFIKS